MAALAITGSSSITRSPEGRVEVKWNNGQILNFVNGGTTDYVAPHFRMIVVKVDDDLHYDMPLDVSRMVAGGVNAKMAVIVGLLRKTVCSLDDCRINMTETARVLPDAQVGVVEEADFEVLAAHPNAVQAIVKQAVTILALNGISLVTAGHHYRADDNVWTKLDSATNIAGHFQTLGIANWEGTIYHDALHPFDIYWKAALVAHLNGLIMPHINGVASKRIPATPAGCASVNVALAAADAMSIIRPDVAPVLEHVTTHFKAIEAKYRADPLSWCAHFKSTRTANNLQYVTMVETQVAFLFGMASFLLEPRSTIRRSAAFKSVASRHQGTVAQGKNFAESLEEAAVITADQATELLTADEAVVARIRAIPVRDDHDDELPGTIVYNGDGEDEEEDAAEEQGEPEAPADIAA